MGILNRRTVGLSLFGGVLLYLAGGWTGSDEIRRLEENTKFQKPAIERIKEQDPNFPENFPAKVKDGYANPTALRLDRYSSNNGEYAELRDVSTGQAYAIMKDSKGRITLTGMLEELKRRAGDLAETTYDNFRPVGEPVREPTRLDVPDSGLEKRCDRKLNYENLIRR